MRPIGRRTVLERSHANDGVRRQHHLSSRGGEGGEESRRPSSSSSSKSGQWKSNTFPSFALSHTRAHVSEDVEARLRVVLAPRRQSFSFFSHAHPRTVLGVRLRVSGSIFLLSFFLDPTLPSSNELVERPEATASAPAPYTCTVRPFSNAIPCSCSSKHKP